MSLERKAAAMTAKLLLPFATDAALRRSETLRSGVLKSREFRIAAEEASLYRPGCLTRIGVGGVKTAIEYLPSGVLWMGWGDLVVLGEALAGRDFPTFEKKDVQDRIVGGILAVAPLVPSVPVRALYRGWRYHIEEKAVQIQMELDQKST